MSAMSEVERQRTRVTVGEDRVLDVSTMHPPAFPRLSAKTWSRGYTVSYTQRTGHSFRR